MKGDYPHLWLEIGIVQSFAGACSSLNWASDSSDDIVFVNCQILVLLIVSKCDNLPYLFHVC